MLENNKNLKKEKRLNSQNLKPKIQKAILSYRLQVTSFMILGGLQKTTLIDYPGKIACTVFLLGCNFRCPFCYSPELVLPERIKDQPKISEKDFFKFLKRKKGLLEGVVICGSEPTFQSELPEFCRKIKSQGFLVKIDTNGSNPEMLEKLIKEKLVDYFALDIKAPLRQFSIFNYQFSKYDKATGVKVDLEKIKESIKIIKNSGVDYEFRTTLIPAIHTKEDILQIARDISPAKKFYLQNFNTTKPLLNPLFQKIKPYDEEYLLEIKKEIESFFEEVGIR